MTDQRRVRRTVKVGAEDAPPKRIRLDILEPIIRQIREAVEAVAEDLGLTDDEIGPVELVDLVAGSTGLRLEQSVPITVIPPLIHVTDAVAARAGGRDYKPIYTDNARRQLDALYEAMMRYTETGVPIGIESLPEGSFDSAWVDSLGPEFTIVDGAASIQRQEPDVAQDMEGDRQEQLEIEDRPTPEWLLRFTADIQRLDRRGKMWLAVGGKDIPIDALLTQDLFAAADSDEARWKTVEIVALSPAPEIRKITEILHCRPTTERIDLQANPVNDAAGSMQLILDRLDGFLLLPIQWDSYNAARIPLQTIKDARGFIILAAAEAQTRGLTLMAPFVAPMSSGHVQLEWESGDRALELEFDGSKIEYFRMAGGDTAEGDAARARALDLVIWVHSGGANDRD